MKLNNGVIPGCGDYDIGIVYRRLLSVQEKKSLVLKR